MYNRRHSYATAGFTLIEILIALFLFVMIVAMISVSLVQILKNSDAIKGKQSRMMDVQAMLAIMEFDLRQVTDIPEPYAAVMHGSFYSQQNGLNFCKMGFLNPDFTENHSSLELVQYIVQNKQLLRYSKSIEGSNYNKQVLIDKVASLSWKFIDGNNNSYAVWPPIYDWAFKKPIAVSAVIELEDLGKLELMVETSTHELFRYKS